MNRLNEIHDYLRNHGVDDETLKIMGGFSVYLSSEIAEYAHRGQRRENGEGYVCHPNRCMEYYRDLIDMDPQDPASMDRGLMEKHGIPYDGVQEVCLLHDVLEDTDFTMEELEEIFDECELGDHFRDYIKPALRNITHNKEEDYPTYIEKCMENPISALCKMMDLQDNCYAFSLNRFGHKNYKRMVDYIGYLYQINSVYRFIEGAASYKRAMKAKKKAE